MKVELTENQLHIIRAALDLYSRVQIGQIEMALEVFPSDKYWQVRDSEAFATVKRELTGYATNASRGIFHPENPPTAIEAYGMQKVIDKYFHDKSGSARMSTASDGKWFDTKEPEIKIED